MAAAEAGAAPLAHAAVDPAARHGSWPRGPIWQLTRRSDMAADPAV